MRRPVRTIILAAAVLASAPASALAGPIISRATAALRSGSVYVDPAAAATLSQSQANALRTAIASQDAGRIKIAVLPQAAANEVPGARPNAVVLALAKAVGKPATYGVIVG